MYKYRFEHKKCIYCYKSEPAKINHLIRILTSANIIFICPNVGSFYDKKKFSC